MLEKPKLYSKFYSKYQIKKEIRDHQFLMCVEQEGKKQLESYKPSTPPNAIKKSLDDFRKRLRTLDDIHANVNSEEVLSTYMPKSSHRAYESFIYKRIKYLNDRDINESKDEEGFIVNDDPDSISQIIKKNILKKNKKTKSLAECVKSLRSLSPIKPLGQEIKRLLSKK